MGLCGPLNYWTKVYVRPDTQGGLNKALAYTSHVLLSFCLFVFSFLCLFVMAMAQCENMLCGLLHDLSWARLKAEILDPPTDPLTQRLQQHVACLIDNICEVANIKTLVLLWYEGKVNFWN